MGGGQVDALELAEDERAVRGDEELAVGTWGDVEGVVAHSEAAVAWIGLISCSPSSQSRPELKLPACRMLGGVW